VFSGWFVFKFVIVDLELSAAIVGLWVDGVVVVMKDDGEVSVTDGRVVERLRGHDASER